MTILVISKRFVPLEQIAFVERFESCDKQDFWPESNWNTRIVLIRAESILTEATVDEFVQEHDFNYLANDGIALNGADVFFSVEAFEPSFSARPQKRFRARLTWRMPGGGEASRLLLTEPVVVAAMMTGPARNSIMPARKPNRPAPLQAALSAIRSSLGFNRN